MSRVSNKQVLDAIEAMPAAIAAAIAGTSAIDPAISSTEPVGSPLVQATDNAPTVDKAYLSHMTGKLQTRSNDTGLTHVLYARTNKANETKLAYCVADKFAGLTDRRIIGAVATISPE